MKSTSKFLPAFSGIFALLLAGLLISFTFLQDEKREERDLPVFKGFSVSIPADVYYTQDKTQRVILEGDPDDLARIVTQVEGSTLKIFTRGFSFRWNGKVKVTLSSAECQFMELSGSGKIISEKPLNTNALDLRLSGSGSLLIRQLNAKSLSGRISGSGNITVGGGSEGSEVDFAISGSGDIHAEEFAAKQGSVKISGSGNCSVQVTEKLEGRISGSGNLYYRGKPMLDVVISGSGKARPL
ncbi:MAG: head GIN domain-containing protein [Bacteroidales bacterium]